MAGGDQPALRQVLMVAKACFVLGLVMAVIGLVAATSNPADFQSQTDAATEAEALRLRSGALTLVLLGVAQAMTAAAAVVVLAGGSLAFMGRCLVASALVVAATNTYLLCRVVYMVAVIAGGNLLDVWTHISIACSFFSFFSASLAATLAGPNQPRRPSPLA
ncbi:hypothetical protein VPH35_118555 [Triticum aestivum]|uniref:uncharacterized protein n=1 Tax=Triticum aestivum TaxID=4565 RepID=UPI001D018F54|nr:uncharacterized protein LOC123141924 [Triticum aestivum]